MEDILKEAVYHALGPYWPELQSLLEAKLADTEAKLANAEAELGTMRQKLMEANRLLEAHGLSPAS